MKPSSFLALLLSAAPCAATAQVQTYTVAKIQFTNPGPYSQAQLEAVAGMHTGTTFTADDLSAATQRLADTGYLGEVGAKTLPGRTAAITVQFQLAPLPHEQMLHLTFENFVWLTPAEIVDAVRSKTLLYDGYVPENNDLLEAVNSALIDALAKKGVSAKVKHDAFEPNLRRPEIDVDYWVETPSVTLGSVKLEGVSTELAPLVQKSADSLTGRTYSGGMPGGTTRERILEPLEDAGYIDSQLTDVIVTPSRAGESVSVAYAATLHAGDVYRVSSILFAGAPLLSASDFASTEKLHAGDIANRSRLMETLLPLDAAYRRAGYADVIVRAEPKEDAQTHEVAYTVTVTPGQVYHVRNVTSNGLTAEAQTNFDTIFPLKPGDIYNPDSLKDFLKHYAALKTRSGPSFSYKAYADPNSHTVDLVLNFGGFLQNVTVYGGQ